MCKKAIQANSLKNFAYAHMLFYLDFKEIPKQKKDSEWINCQILFPPTSGLNT